MEVKDEVAQEEDDERDATKNNELVAPAHVATGGAASHAFGDGIASGQLRCGGRATVFGSSAIRNGRSEHDAHGLPERQEGYHVTVLLRNKFKSNRGINGDVATEAKTCQEINAADCPIVVGWSCQNQAEDGGDETGQVESPGKLEVIVVSINKEERSRRRGRGR